MDKLLKRTLNEKIRTQRYPSRSYYSLMAEKESIRLSARTGEFTRVSGACNGEFGGAAVVCNQCLFDCTESLFAEKERSVVAMQQTSLLLRGIPANFSNLTRYAPLLFIFTIKYKHFLRI